jgi:hypothetical protein
MKRFATVVAATFLVTTPVCAQEWGNIKGRVVWKPEIIPVQMPIAAVGTNADKAQCLKDGPVLDENWVVSKKSRGLRWSVVWLINDDPKDKTALPIHPKLKTVPAEAVVVDQPACAFIPHVIAMREGQVLVTKNSSSIAHNIKWTGAKNMGNVVVPAGKELQIKDLVAERVPIQIECNFHPWMRGYVGIFNHPYFAVTDADGNFEVKNAPAGNYRLVVWNTAFNGGAPGRFGQRITIPAGDTLKLGNIEFTPPK